MATTTTTVSDRTATLAALRAELAIADYKRITFWCDFATRSRVDAQIREDRAKGHHPDRDPTIEKYIPLFDRANALQAAIADLTDLTPAQEFYLQCEADNRLRERLNEAWGDLKETQRILGIS